MTWEQKTQPLLRRVRRARGRIICKEKVGLGKRNCVAKEPYHKWVKEWAQKIKLPFNCEVPIPPQAHEPTHVPIQEAEELKATITKLEKENEEIHPRLKEVTSEINKLRFNLGQKEKQLGESEEATIEERDKRKRFKHCLEGTSLDLDHRNQEI